MESGQNAVLIHTQKSVGEIGSCYDFKQDATEQMLKWSLRFIELLIGFHQYQYVSATASKSLSFFDDDIRSQRLFYFKLQYERGGIVIQSSCL